MYILLDIYLYVYYIYFMFVRFYTLSYECEQEKGFLTLKKLKQILVILVQIYFDKSLSKKLNIDFKVQIP
jgi:hypothetical protein